MTTQQREYLINFCVYTRAELEGVLPAEVDRSEFEKLTDEQLEREADWLEEVLGK